jgi:hypothetical protein
MAFPNISDILATTIESRTKQIADNVTKNNAVLMKLEMSGRIKPFSGGHKILQELSFAENANGGWYSGYDILPVGVSDVISAAEYNIKQAAVPVVISGLEQLQNASKERMIDLMDSRLSVAESTLANLIAGGIYSDGTGAGGKQIDGLDAAIPAVATASQTDTYGGIDRTTWAFWRTQFLDAASTDSIQEDWNTLWASLVRGTDRPDLIMVDSVVWGAYVASLQALQRFTDPQTGQLGFPTIKYMDADVCLDGGIGGFCPAGTAFFLNTDYIHYRPHSARNMVPLSPNRRYATNQDAEVQIIGWAGNLTTSGAQFQGRYDGNA